MGVSLEHLAVPVGPLRALHEGPDVDLPNSIRRHLPVDLQTTLMLSDFASEIVGPFSLLGRGLAPKGRRLRPLMPATNREARRRVVSPVHVLRKTEGDGHCRMYRRISVVPAPACRILGYGYCFSMAPGHALGASDESH